MSTKKVSSLASMVIISPTKEKTGHAFVSDLSGTSSLFKKKTQMSSSLKTLILDKDTKSMESIPRPSDSVSKTESVTEDTKMAEHSNMILNRIEKNWKKIKKQANKNNWDAVRLYDRDIPEFPYIVEKYKDHFVVWEKGKENYDYREKQTRPPGRQPYLFCVRPPKIIFKQRQRKGSSSIRAVRLNQPVLTIQEGSFSFQVNIKDFLDTGYT